MAKKEFYADGSGKSVEVTHCSYASNLLRARAVLNAAMGVQDLPGPVRVNLLRAFQPALVGVNLISDCRSCILPTETRTTSDLDATAHWINQTGEAQICPNARNLQELAQEVISAILGPRPPQPPGGNRMAA